MTDQQIGLCTSMYTAAAILIERRELRAQRRQTNYIYIWNTRYTRDQCTISVVRNADDTIVAIDCRRHDRRTDF
jgi:hypothetical protein